MIELEQALIEEAIDDLDDIEDGLADVQRRTGRYSLYRQIEQTVDREVTTPILQRAKQLGRNYVGDHVRAIEAADGRWEGSQYRTGLTSDSAIVLSHEFGSGQYGAGNGPYVIEPGPSNEYLVFEYEGHPITVEMVIHPGVRGKRFMQQAVRESQDELARELADDVQQTLEDAIGGQ